MSVFVVTRHPGAIEWIKLQGIEPTAWLRHISEGHFSFGDTVIGCLPIPLIADLTNRGIRYFHISFNMPESLRGHELTAEQLVAFGASLHEFEVFECNSYRSLND